MALRRAQALGLDRIDAQLLHLLALELKRQARAGDVLSRFGGEEFVLLMPNTSLGNAQNMAERLRAGAQRLVISHDGRTLRFTVSLGVSSTDTVDNATPGELLVAADKGLYLAKERGRNRVEVFVPTAQASTSL